VIVPDLRGFGDSDVSPDGSTTCPSHASDLYALVHDVLGHDRVVLLGGDLGGPVIQDLALRHPEWVDRMVLFNSPAAVRQGGDEDIAGHAPGEGGERLLRAGQGDRSRRASPRAGRRLSSVQRYIETCYTSRLWAHPGCGSAVATGSGDGGASTTDRSVTARSCCCELRRVREHVRAERAEQAEPTRAATTSDSDLILPRDRASTVIYPRVRS
jgi:pimeloyl-ACP methyl ester carboxylesterase